jgi:hypothetical protein
MPTESQGTISRSGGMSVSLSSPDGRVVGGGVAGLLVAATPVQVNICRCSLWKQGHVCENLLNHLMTCSLVVFSLFL